MYTWSCGTVLSLPKISSSCRSDYMYVKPFFIVIVSTYLMKETSTIRSVDTEFLFMPLWSCHFPSNTKYSVLIHYARASQTFLFSDPILKDKCFYAVPLMDRLDQLCSTRRPHAARQPGLILIILNLTFLIQVVLSSATLSRLSPLQLGFERFQYINLS